MTEQPATPDPKQLRASDADRERYAQLLHTAMGEGRITMDELEERLGTVYGAKTVGELEPVIADLPQAGTLAPTAATQPAAGGTNLPERRIGGAPGSTMSVAVMAGTERKGSWVVPPQHTSLAFWGGVEIDLRKARFAEAHSTITAIAVMGGIDIIVPDDIHVEVTGIGFMGAFESRSTKGAEDDAARPGAPVVRVNGLAFWGGVEVKRVPADPEKAKKRKQLPE